MRVLIADDHSLFRESLRGLMESRGHEVVAEARNGDEAVDLAGRVEPEVVLMDLNMPGKSGMEAIREILEARPKLPIVVLTGSMDDEDLFGALRAGAQGFLRKDLEADSFFELLEGVAAGEPALTPELSRKVLREFASRKAAAPDQVDPDALTEREMEVLQSMVAGVTSNRSLAMHLGVSENTVKFHVRNILDKLHLHDRAQAVSHALRSGMVDLDEFEGV